MAYFIILFVSLYGVRNRPNVLFIAVDDLRTELGCYGSPLAKTPHIDQMASMGTLFERAYCQQAVCGPSRVSLLCGQRPDTTKVWSLFTRFRDIQPEIITLPQFFKNHRYHSYRLGKIFHRGHGNKADHISWNPVKYSSPLFIGKKLTIKNYINHSAGQKPTTEKANVPDNYYRDGAITDHAIKAIEHFKENQTSFFLAVGYSKPHLPFCAPKKYWDLYNREGIPNSPTPSVPEGASKYSLYNDFGEMRKYDGVPASGPVSIEHRKELRHGYLACVSYIDAQVGRLMDTLEKNNLMKNTIIILWGDHGWKLNDYASWCKHSNMELDVWVPLIVVAPNCKPGQRSSALVELVDIYPTLTELCDFDIPNQCEGNSMVPLLKDPNRTWKKAAFSQYPRKEGEVKVMGYSIRTEKWRYTEWVDQQSKSVLDRELYDHSVSPFAKKNVSEDSENIEIVRKLSLMLNKGKGWERIKNELGNN